MDHTDQVIDLFHRHIESCMYTMEALAEGIAEASHHLVDCMLHDHKVMCCGEGSSGLIAQHLATNLLNSFAQERPSLPAIALNADTATATAIAAQFSYNDIFANQIRALGQAGDCLVLCYQGSGTANSLRCIQAAHERGMRVVSLSNFGGGDASALLSPDDVELIVPVEERARVTEMQLVAVHALCELIDAQLFGT
ncbi:SIS domain-containing protein [Spongiibacter nanhainus]|uniref:SIS domain-containing protein n=1 Tax=Spongiibacter nanhainus TaxID=2794344 RepID=A0A7T4R255_9GAMM|nr:SIS domain-containing protein [Spongiibacter nanhainus]QQD19061.1 SIS domain-containing protein [Spongiibacter nanhainus]